MYLCKGICKKFKAKKPSVDKSRYELGQKLCKVCAIFLNYNDTRCPCCNCKLRTIPRSPKHRRLLLKQTESVKKKSRGNLSAYSSEKKDKIFKCI